MKKLALALAIAVSAATAASAQGVYIEHRGDRGWDGDRGVHRGWERSTRRGWDDGGRVIVRRGFRDVGTTGSLGCRKITVRKQDNWGNTVVKRIQRCD
jgi:hypothetical protein